VKACGADEAGRRSTFRKELCICRKVAMAIVCTEIVRESFRFICFAVGGVFRRANVEKRLNCGWHFILATPYSGQ